MAKPKYESPTIRKTAFNCQHCSAYAHQIWFRAGATSVRGIPRVVEKEELPVLVEIFKREDMHTPEIEENILARRPVLSASSESTNSFLEVWFSQCFRCKNFAIWVSDRVVWPQTGGVPSPNSDLPDDVKADYEEASAILGFSPRGSAALLRLGIQKLCKHLGGKGDSLNADIGSLMRRGLNIEIQQALDTIRVIGNNAVHPGQIDLRDDRETARSLFDLVNLIADSMISQPKSISKMFDKLPDRDIKGIKSRDTSKRQ